MGSMLRGRHFITTQEFSKSELDLLLDVSSDLKRKFAIGEPTPLLDYKTVFLIFFDESTRTRNSMECGITQLGGHGNFLNPKTMQTAHGEVARDTARILSRYGHAIAVRHCTFKIGNAYLRKLAEFSETPNTARNFAPLLRNYMQMKRCSLSSARPWARFKWRMKSAAIQGPKTFLPKGTKTAP